MTVINDEHYQKLDVTKVLYVAGILLAAHFASNDFRRTIVECGDGLGSPIIAVTHTFWNIRLTPRMCVLLDIVTDFDVYPNGGSKCSCVQDSFFILSVMNQYTMTIPQRSSA